MCEILEYYIALYARRDAFFSVSAESGPLRERRFAKFSLEYLSNEAKWARGVYRVSGWDPRDPTSGSVCGAETVMSGAQRPQEGEE